MVEYRVVACLVAVGLALASVPLAAQGARPVAQEERRAVLGEAAQLLDSLYVKRPLARRLRDALQAGSNRGRWDRLTDPEVFADSVTRALRSLAGDQHLRLVHDPVGSRVVENITPEERARRRTELLDELADGNYGIPELRILPGNIGLLRIENFSVPRLGAATLAAAMEFVSHTRGLIIDLRDNGGGHEDQYILMMSYFLSEPTLIGETFSRPDSSVTQVRTYASVAGPRYDPGKPIYILTSKNSFSAAEALAAGLRKYRGAIVVGETTRGGGNLGDFYPLGGRFVLFVPSAASTMGDEIEGRGVVPDVVISAEKALLEAQLRALRAVLRAMPAGGRRTEIEGVLRQLESTP